MTLPTPHPGLVISYEFLWADEADLGLETGQKARPCVIVLAVKREQDGLVVTVAPVTHSPPRSSEEAIEMPRAIKRHLGLDDARSWVVLSELNQFTWPGFDLARRAGPGGGFQYGVTPPRFLAQIVSGIGALWNARRGRLVRRR